MPLMPDTAGVSVVIPCFAAAEVLPRAVASVLTQTHAALEILLVDDASNDQGLTRRVIEDLARKGGGKADIRPLFLGTNQGPAGARNAGWDRARGDYVAFLDADDAWHPQKLEIQLDWMTRHPDCVASAHGSVLTTPATLPQTVPLPVDGRAVLLGSMLFRNAVLTRTVMLRKDVSQRFPAGMRHSEDYALWLAMLADGARIDMLDAPLALSFRPPFSPGGQSGALAKMERAELGIYRDLARSGAISRPLALAASTFSLLKYGRRVLTQRLRGRTR